MPSVDATTQSNGSGRLLAMGARGLGTLVLALSFFVFVLATPPFSYGVWFQTEPVAVALQAAGAAAGLCLLALELTGHPIGLLLGRRHVQFFLAFLAWNAVASATQDFPGRAWLGTPETGEGNFSFLALLMLVLLAMAIWPYRVARSILIGAAIGSTLAIGGMDMLLPAGSAWRPEKYAAYAGTVGPPAMMIVAGGFRRPGWRVLAVAALVGLVPVVFSENKTAIGLLCLVGPVSFVPIVLVVRRIRIARARAILAWLPLIALLATSAALLGVLIYGQYDPLYSVWSRGLLIWAGLLAFADHPLALLTGFGWGSYNDLLYQHNFLPGVRGFVNGVWDPNWEGVGAGAFHVHNDIAEAVLAAGPVGGALYLLLFSAIVAGTRRGMLAIGAVGWFLVVGSLCFWYPFQLSYPFLAVAIAATTAPMGSLRSPTVVSLDGWVRGVGIGLTVALAAGSWMSAQDARAAGARLAALNRQDAGEVGVFGAFPADHNRGGVHLWWLALSEASFIGEQLLAGHPPTPGAAAWYGRILNEVDVWVASGRGGRRLEALTLALRNDLIANHEHTALAALRERELPKWEPAMLRVIHRDPDRTDVAVPFMAFLALTGQYSRIIGTCAQIAAIHPNDRVCLWYTGIAMLPDPATARRGLESMHAALAAHVEAVAPVLDAARDMVETTLANGPR